MVQKILAILALLVGLLAVFFVFVFKPAEKKLRPANPAGHIAQAVPYDVGKWHGVDKPLAETEEVLHATESVLQLDDFINREYSNSKGSSFTLYIAYWGQGKLPTSLASKHVPDRCWTKNGWANIGEFKKFGDEFVVDGKALQSLTSRKFEFDIPHSQKKMIRYVWYWFLIEGEVLDFKTFNARVVNPVVYVKNLMHEASKGIPEQHFVRIDSATPLEELYKDPDFKQMLKYLGDFVLYKKDER